MTQHNTEAPIVPPSAFININHLGLSEKERFDDKQHLIRSLARRNSVLGIQELHCSSARAQDLFFNHFASHIALYNSSGTAPGQALMVSRSWLDSLNLCPDDAKLQHCIVVPNVAQAFWAKSANKILCICNVYLDAHDARLRIEQLTQIVQFIEQFKTEHAGMENVFVVGGDRNFVVRPEQHNSSRGTSWWPGGPTMSAWSEMLQQLGNPLDTELDEHTWIRKLRSSDGSNQWIHRTIDFAAVSLDPVRNMHLQISVSMFRDGRGDTASDHRAVEVRAVERKPPSRQERNRQRATWGVPEWLSDNASFSHEFELSVQAWLPHRQRGLYALGEFVEMAQAFGKEWIIEKIVEATSAQHKFDICMVAQSHACHNVSVPMRKINKWCRVYPRLRALLEFHIDESSSSVRVVGTDAFFQHVHELASEIAELQVERESNNDVSSGSTLRNNLPHKSAVEEIKRLTPLQRTSIVSLWNEDRSACVTEPSEIAKEIREAGAQRSGVPRGDRSQGDRLLANCSVDLSGCRSVLSLTEVMQLLLSIQRGKKPGSTGICGALYKRHALALAPIFLEAFEQLQDDDIDMSTLPAHVRDGLWVPIAKRTGADSLDAIRDLELPNEDLKVIERMLFKVLDEIAAPQILPLNQAFVTGGDIMHNVFGLHASMQAHSGVGNLRLFLLMDCTKGFNLASHSWTSRVLEQMRLPTGLRRMVDRLLAQQRGILSFGGSRHEPVAWKCGFRQGGPLSAILFVLIADPFLASLACIDGVEEKFGFCDDWQAVISDMAAIRQVRQLVEEYEKASGLQIHRTKTVWLSSRALTPHEFANLRIAWPDAKLVDKQVVLGTPLGRNVSVSEFCAKPLRALYDRIAVYKKLRISLGMRVLIANTFLLPVFSYVGRIIFIPVGIRNEVSKVVLRFVSPAPFCKLSVFAQLRQIFKIPMEIKDLLFDNIAGLLATAFRLQQDRNRWGRLMSELDHVMTWSSDEGSACPMSSVASAYVLFRSQVGESFDSFSNRFVPLSADGHSKAKLHAAAYRALMRSDTDRVRDELRQRFQQKGLDAERIFANLKRMPSSMPAGHLLYLFRLLLNGLPTSRRMRFVSGEPEKHCCFCGSQFSDSQHHWAQCSTLRNVCARVYGQGFDQRIVNANAMMLQYDYDGHALHQIVRFWLATWKIRNVLVRGFEHHDENDLVHHFLCVIDDPWLVGHPEARSRADRRRSRVRPPQALPGWHVYNSDGASRSHSEMPRQASLGAELSIDGAVVARLGIFLGDCTNNVAEYNGIKEALEHARALHPSRVCFRVDSKLVCEQLGARWACRAPDLVPLYETCLEIIADLKRALGPENVRIDHVYREFNAGADSLANIAIDNFVPGTGSAIVVNENWSPYTAPA